MSTIYNLPMAGSHPISLHYAIQLTSRLRNNRELLLDIDYKGGDVIPLSETFNRADIDQLLAQEGAAGLRIYYGMDVENRIHAVLVAVNENNQDLIPMTTSRSMEALILQEGQRCPVICPPESPLNH